MDLFYIDQVSRIAISLSLTGRIPYVWSVDFVSFEKSSSAASTEPMEFGFLVKVDIELEKLNELKEQFPILKDEKAIKIEIEERAFYKPEKNAQSGAKIL